MILDTYKTADLKKNISENAIFNAIRDFIKTNNFPKKLVLKKLDLLIDKKKERITKYAKMLASARQTNKEMLHQTEVLKTRNNKEISDLVQYLS